MSNLADRAGVFRRRSELARPAAYAVFDCETTGTDPRVDEIVSLAVARLDGDGIETGRYVRLVRPSQPIPPEATAVHGIDDADLAAASRFSDIADEVLALLDGAVFVAHNASFDLAMLRNELARAGVEYEPAGIACTLDAFRLLEPLADDHRLTSICARRGMALADAHNALGDALATAALLRVLLDKGIAPETIELDHAAFMRLRAHGDTRPASEPQIRRVFGMARSAGLLGSDGGIDRHAVVSLVAQCTGGAEIEVLTREQVQAVYDQLDRLIETRNREAA